MAPAPGACLIAADSTVPRLDTVVVALARPDAERFLAHHLNSNLVTLDCAGDLRPELATDWIPEDGGRTWVFTLRPAANGIRPAERVWGQWEAQRNGGLWPWPAILEVEVVDSIRLRVRLDRAYPELPPEFADSSLAVSDGPYRTQYVASPSAGPVTSTAYLVPANGRGPVIKLETLRPNVDARDALDFPRAALLSPADVVITRDAATVAYARNRREFTTAPVGWDRTYVLLTPRLTPGTALAISDETRRGLVRDVVRGDVRAAAPPFWFDSLPCLATFNYPPPDSSDGPLIAFPGSDPVARALAERLAAVATTRIGPRTMATDTTRLDFPTPPRAPNAFVLSFPRRHPVSCDAVTRWPAGSRIDPLVDLRSFVILRHGVPPLLLDGDGRVRISDGEAP